MSDDLIARLEAASNGSRELDAAIAVAVYGAGSHDPGTALAYTTSLDAAMMLVPEGSDWTARTRMEHPYHGKFPAEAVVWRERQAGFAQTPALALCIAALKARAA